MTNAFSRPPGDGGTTPASTPVRDDASDHTPRTGRNGGQQDAFFPEKTIKFRFQKTDANDAVHPAQFHLHWIQAVQETFGPNI
jgi:hypothetical protein